MSKLIAASLLATLALSASALARTPQCIIESTGKTVETRLIHYDAAARVVYYDVLNPERPGTIFRNSFEDCR